MACDVVNFYCCRTWQIRVVLSVEGCGDSSAECLVNVQLCIHLVCVCRGFCGVRSWVL